MLKSNQQLVSDMCKSLLSQGVTHIVMENLQGGFGKSFIKDKKNDVINFNRVVSFLRISSLKSEVEHIANEYGIAVSTVQPYYTSKMCPICGCIDDENRETQEEFRCVECEHSDNAVLRGKLLKQLDNGAYEPKKLKCEKVKEVLLSFRRTLQENARSEYIESGHPTFDYI